jgi:hypothetical protein
MADYLAQALPFQQLAGYPPLVKGAATETAGLLGSKLVCSRNRAQKYIEIASAPVRMQLLQICSVAAFHLAGENGIADFLAEHSVKTSRRKLN